MAHDHLFFLTWKTWLSLPVLDRDWGTRLVGLLPELARREESRLSEIAVVPTHVHVVAQTAARVDIPRLAQRLKGASARYLNLARGTRLPMRWSPGYDARSMSRRSLPQVRGYMDDQARKHQLDWVLRWSEGMQWPMPDEPRVLAEPR